MVKKLTQMNLTVCATIHSPTPYCFNQFDRLHLLLRGQTVYFGPNGAPQCSPSVLAKYQSVCAELLAARRSTK